MALLLIGSVQAFVLDDGAGQASAPTAAEPKQANPLGIVTSASAGPEWQVRSALVDAAAGRELPRHLRPAPGLLRTNRADLGNCNYALNMRRLCPRGAPDGDRTLVVTGDSHARAWIPAFERIANEYGYQAYYLVKPQCPSSFVLPASVNTGEPWPECPAFHRWVTKKVAQLDPDLVVMTSTAPVLGVYNDEGKRVVRVEALADELDRGYRAAFETLRPLADRVVLLGDVPRLPPEPTECLNKGAHPAECTLWPDLSNEYMIADSARAARAAGIESINPADWFCTASACPLVVGDTIAFRDRGHITTARAVQLSGTLAEALEMEEFSQAQRLADISPRNPFE